MTDYRNSPVKRPGKTVRFGPPGRTVFYYMQWRYLVCAAVFAALSYLSFYLAMRGDEYKMRQGVVFVLGGLCLLFIFIACIFVMIFQGKSFEASPDDKSEIVDDRDLDYEERQKKIREREQENNRRY